MGATGWEYAIPYQEDIHRALDDLKQKVFSEGEFEKIDVDIWFLDELGFFEADSEEREKMLPQYGLNSLRHPLAEVGIEGLRDWLERLNAAPTFASMEELNIARSLSMGTGSILDIDDIFADSQGYGLYPLSEQRVQEFFGTDRPTRSIVEKWRHRIPAIDEENYHQRGEGVYVIIYENDVPTEIYIEGSSGD